MTPSHRSWMLTPGDFLSAAEVLRLRRATAQAAAAGGVPTRDWFLVDLAMSSGLRVSELAALAVQDVWVEHVRAVHVRHGKGNRQRLVHVDPAVAAHVDQFLAWKRERGEPREAASPLFWSSVSGRALTPRALQKAFKRCAARAGLPTRFSIHSLRHTYATHLYRASGYNLRLVQKQLGHARITTTQVYADVLDADAERTLARPLYA